MSKELVKLKEEIKKEIMSELEENYSKKKSSIWTKYANEYLEPKLNEMFRDNARIRYQVRIAICTLVRVNAKISNVVNISESDLEKSKPLIDDILEVLNNS